MGKNMKGSDVALESVSPFWIIDSSDNNKLKINPRLNDMKWPFTAWRTTEKDGHVTTLQPLHTDYRYDPG